VGLKSLRRLQYVMYLSRVSKRCNVRLYSKRLVFKNKLLGLSRRTFWRTLPLSAMRNSKFKLYLTGMSLTHNTPLIKPLTTFLYNFLGASLINQTTLGLLTYSLLHKPRLLRFFDFFEKGRFSRNLAALRLLPGSARRVTNLVSKLVSLTKSIKLEIGPLEGAPQKLNRYKRKLYARLALLRKLSLNFHSESKRRSLRRFLKPS